MKRLLLLGLLLLQSCFATRSAVEMACHERCMKQPTADDLACRKQCGEDDPDKNAY